MEALRQWQRGDRLRNSFTDETGKVARLVRHSPVHHPTVIIAHDKGGVTAGAQEALQQQGWIKTDG